MNCPFCKESLEAARQVIADWTKATERHERHLKALLEHVKHLEAEIEKLKNGPKDA